jgi:hypothetical protein
MEPDRHLLVLGHGYCSQYFLRSCSHGFGRISVTTRSPEKASHYRQQGLAAHVLDAPVGTVVEGLAEDMSRASHLLVCAPPDGEGDAMLRLLYPHLARAARLQTIVYFSTTSVYGDHQGQWVSEATPLTPSGARGQRRVQAERQWLDFAQKQGLALWRFRLAGIYGPGRNALEHVRAGKARCVIKLGQVFNRVHVHDVARAINAAFHTPELACALNICDDKPAPPQDITAFAAALLKVPAPAPVGFDDACLPPTAQSFFEDNKRVSNRLMKKIFSFTMSYPDYRAGLTQILADEAGINAPFEAVRFNLFKEMRLKC